MNNKECLRCGREMELASKYQRYCKVPDEKGVSCERYRKREIQLRWLHDKIKNQKTKMFNLKFWKKKEEDTIKRPTRNLKEIADLITQSVQMITTAMVALDELLGNTKEFAEKKPDMRMAVNMTSEERQERTRKAREARNATPEESVQGVEMLKHLISRHDSLNQTAEFIGTSIGTLAHLVNMNPPSMRTNTLNKIKVAYDKLQNQVNV